MGRKDGYERMDIRYYIKKSKTLLITKIDCKSYKNNPLIPMG
jgi:hypothetical protein